MTLCTRLSKTESLSENSRNSLFYVRVENTITPMTQITDISTGSWSLLDESVIYANMQNLRLYCLFMRPDSF